MAESKTQQRGLGKELREALASFWDGSVRWDAPMAEYCTLRAGGRAAAMVVVDDQAGLSRLIKWLTAQDIRRRVIGRGSNILVSSRGFDGVVIVLGRGFCEIKPEQALTGEAEKYLVRAGAGCSAAGFLGWCVRQGLTGLEFMAGIPGSVGGAVCMNAGAWGKETGQVVETVCLVDRRGGYHELGEDTVVFAYRSMQFKKPEYEQSIVTGAVFRLRPGNQRQIIETCRRHVAARKEKQPAGAASAGSFFKNPPGDSAGRLIEAAGLKGLRRGEAMVSEKHANFIVNMGNATADDIMALAREVQSRVFEQSGIHLEPEVHLL